MKRTVLSYLSRYPSINNRELRALTSVGYDQAVAFFARMVKGGHLRRTGKGSKTKYILRVLTFWCLLWNLGM